MVTVDEHSPPPVARRLHPRARSLTWGFVEERLNADWHRTAVLGLTAVVIAHWAEHVAQAIQVLAGWAPERALGLVGLAFPTLVQSEWLHYVYNFTIWIALIALARGFVGSGHGWWKGAIYIQAWHHLEHVLLLVQALTGTYLLAKDVPTSIAQLFAPRLELHFFYNTVATLPMIVAMYIHSGRATKGSINRGCDCISVATLWSRPRSRGAED